MDKQPDRASKAKKVVKKGMAKYSKAEKRAYHMGKTIEQAKINPKIKQSLENGRAAAYKTRKSSKGTEIIIVTR
jgi:hypothetical protein